MTVYMYNYMTSHSGRQQSS